MFGYEKEGLRGTIMLSHVSSFGAYDNNEYFDVFLDDGTGKPDSVPIEYYDDFKMQMFHYLQTKETK